MIGAVECGEYNAGVEKISSRHCGTVIGAVECGEYSIGVENISLEHSETFIGAAGHGEYGSRVDRGPKGGAMLCNSLLLLSFFPSSSSRRTQYDLDDSTVIQ